MQKNLVQIENNDTDLISSKKLQFNSGLAMRYIQGASLTLEGIRGTKAVFIAIGLVCLLQALFTYAPFMHMLFKSEPLSFMQCIFIGMIGIMGFSILEIDKLVFLSIRRYRKQQLLKSCSSRKKISKKN